MITRVELTNYLHDLLGCANFNDYAPNGLQVEGMPDIRVICTAVTASAKAIEEAAKMNASALLVHHGYFWRGESPVITGMKYERIALLFQHTMNLFAYHLPLDCHLTLGNNVCLGKLLGLQSITQHTAGNTSNLLWLGSFANAMTAEALDQFLTEQLHRKPQHIEGSDRLIKRIAWCSGAAQDFITQAHALGADAYLSGEISERTYYEAKELGIHYFACGHHATERLGIRALGEHLSDHFGIFHHFIDTDNPV